MAMLLIAGPAWAAEGMPKAAEMLPSSGALPGWMLVGEPEEFPGEDLWKHINGAADRYLDYGCTSLAVAYYRLEGSESEIAVEIYRMEDELGSFGIYTLERPLEGPFLEVGAQGYQAGGELNFFGGPNYIKLQVFPAEEAELEAERNLAGVIAGEHLSGNAFPEELALFPREGLVEDSFGLAPDAVLGLKGLRKAVFAKYRFESGDMTLHLVREMKLETAEAAFTTMRESLRKRSSIPLREITIGTAGGVQGDLKYHGPVLLLRSGKDIVLASGATDEKRIQGTVALLLANLAR
jgi:hypothetical protein